MPADRILKSLRRDPAGTLESVFLDNRPALRRLVAARMNRQLVGRVDPSDILQETLVDACQRLQDYLSNPTVPFIKWLYLLAEQNTFAAYRKHVEAKKRSTTRERRLNVNDNTGVREAFFGQSHLTGPVQSAEKRERIEQLHRAISMLSPSSQTIVRRRFFDGRSLAEIANEMEISVDAVSKRLMRSLLKLSAFAAELGIVESE